MKAIIAATVLTSVCFPVAAYASWVVREARARGLTSIVPVGHSLGGGICLWIGLAASGVGAIGPDTVDPEIVVLARTMVRALVIVGSGARLRRARSFAARPTL